ncbi:MAG: sporulation protein YabP [Clostridium sp.]|uniref:sporulation protein YabP n=1 Tax=Clostridium sp. TaxID=1506 RepID=UPI002FC6E510
MDKEKITDKIENHNIKLEGRKRLELIGVTEVLTFNEDNIVLETSLGALAIKGGNMKVGKLNVESGDMCIDGYIISLTYVTKDKAKKESILKKMFK